MSKFFEKCFFVFCVFSINPFLICTEQQHVEVDNSYPQTKSNSETKKRHTKNNNNRIYVGIGIIATLGGIGGAIYCLTPETKSGKKQSPKSKSTTPKPPINTTNSTPAIPVSTPDPVTEPNTNTTPDTASGPTPAIPVPAPVPAPDFTWALQFCCTQKQQPVESLPDISRGDISKILSDYISLNTQTGGVIYSNSKLACDNIYEEIHESTVSLDSASSARASRCIIERDTLCRILREFNSKELQYCGTHMVFYHGMGARQSIEIDYLKNTLRHIPTGFEPDNVAVCCRDFSEPFNFDNVEAFLAHCNNNGYGPSEFETTKDSKLLEDLQDDTKGLTFMVNSYLKIDADFSDVLMSAGKNPFVQENVRIQNQQQIAFYYFMKNYEDSSYDYKIIKKLYSNKQDEIDNHIKHLNQMESSLPETARGSMLQIFIPKNLIQTLVYAGGLHAKHEKIRDLNESNHVRILLNPKYFCDPNAGIKIFKYNSW